MRKRGAFQGPRGGQFKPETVPSPVGGLNAFDSLVAMPETDAFIFQNWWPQPYGCSVRKGYVEWSTGLPGAVETLASWPSLTGTSRLFAWSGTGMYNAESRGPIGSPVVTELANARWETAIVTNAAGSRLLAVNGIDNPIIFNGSVYARITSGDGIAPNTWAGFNPQLAVQLTVHQRRLWAVQKDSTVGWYLPPDAVQGTFVAFDFGSMFSRGGFLQFLSTWTIDDGSGAQDRLVAVSSNGEAVVYAGTNPNNAATWALAGVYFIGPPVSGRRGFAKVGGDLVILTARGAVSLSSEIVSIQAKDAENPVESRKVQFLLSELTSLYASLNGWQLSYFAPINMLMINVPSVVEGGSVQLAANQITKAWTQFLGMDSACWAQYQGLPYFGGYTGVIYRAWTGHRDQVKLNNSDGFGIVSLAQQAYTYFGGRSNGKQVGMYRPVFVASGLASYSSAIVYDFVDNLQTIPSIQANADVGTWNVSKWGGGRWSGGTTVQQSWNSAEGLGAAVSIKMTLVSDTDVLWVSTDYSLVQTSGIL